MGGEEIETSCRLLILKTYRTSNLKRKKRVLKRGPRLATHAPKLIFKDPPIFMKIIYEIFKGPPISPIFMKIVSLYIIFMM